MNGVFSEFVDNQPFAASGGRLSQSDSSRGWGWGGGEGSDGIRGHLGVHLAQTSLKVHQ